MLKLIMSLFLFLSSICSASIMKSYRLVWDTSKIASFGMGYGYNIFTTRHFQGQVDVNGNSVRLYNENVFGPVVEAEVGISGYEYLAGIKFGKVQKLARSTYLFTFFTGRSENWMDLKTNIAKEHYIAGVRLNRKFVDWAIKYHTDFKKDKLISIQFGISG